VRQEERDRRARRKELESSPLWQRLQYAVKTAKAHQNCVYMNGLIVNGREKQVTLKLEQKTRICSDENLIWAMNAIKANHPEDFS
jgi:hypothetical protein